MKLSDDDLWRLHHVLATIADIEECLARNPREDKIVYIALERLVGNIGEACRTVSAELKAAYPDIPWARINGMRNAVIHEYHKVKKERVWDVAEHKIPALKDWITGIIEAHKSST
jgi:uncharacterized protein with HEPN domain